MLWQVVITEIGFTKLLFRISSFYDCTVKESFNVIQKIEPYIASSGTIVLLKLVKV